MGSPSASRRKTLCSRKSSAVRAAARRASSSPVATANSWSPHIGGSDSLKEERRPVAFLSQFQPPSGHCHSISDSASNLTRGSSAIPRRQHTASAFPSWDPQRRVRPSMTLIPRRCPGPVSQASTGSTAATQRGSPGGTPSSTSETSRQCAPLHFAYGWPPKPPSGCWPESSVRTSGPSSTASASRGRSTSSRSRSAWKRTPGSSDSSSHSTAGSISGARRRAGRGGRRPARRRRDRASTRA